MQAFFVFQFQGKYYKYESLSDVTPTLRKLDDNVISFLDDIFICGDTFEESRDAFVSTNNLLFKLSSSVHPEISQLTPLLETEYLKFVINSITIKIHLVKTKQDEIKNLIEETKKLKVKNKRYFQILGKF